MATLTLTTPLAMKVKIERISLTLLGENPQMTVALAFGDFVEERFVTVHRKVIQVDSAAFAIFLAQFAAMESQFMNFLIGAGYLSGTIE